MSPVQSTREKVTVRAENIGGIDTTEVEFTPGVTILTGRNATNRTSFLQTIMAALGSEHVSLKGDADEGEVELIIGDETYTRTLSRQGGTVTTEGEPFLDDPELADLFSFLLESNEARRAVARSDNLRELIMRPVDTEEIQQSIERLENERRDIEGQLDELSDLQQRLPSLEQRRTEIESQIEEKREELEAKEEEIAEADADVEETRKEKAELEDKLEELRDTRSKLEDVRFNLDVQQDSIQALKDELEEYESELDTLPETPMGELDGVEDELERLRSEKQRLDAEVGKLESIIQFNEEMLDGTDEDVLNALRDGEESDGSVTDQLVDDSQTVTCWTCGSTVEKQEIRGTVERLRDLREEKIGQRNDLRSDIDDSSTRQAELREKQRQRDQLERSIERTEGEIDEREGRIEELKEERESLNDDIERLETEVEDLEGEDYSEILDLHKEANQFEFELGKLQNELDDVEDEIASVDRKVGERDELEDRRDEINDELEELRTRIERIEREAVEEFNEHMDSVLDILDYSNLDRIWIERTEKQVREGRRKVEKSTFDLHVVRSTETGATYEDTIDHLSESEREVTGLVFALAGYLVHDVYEKVPFMLLDSLEAVDSERIAALVDYFTQYPDYLVVALLPEDAAALDDDYQRVTTI